MTRIKCTRCGVLFTGATEYDAEIAFNNHECRRKGRSMWELTDEELMEIIEGRATEDEIFERKAK